MGDCSALDIQSPTLKCITDRGVPGCTAASGVTRKRVIFPYGDKQNSLYFSEYRIEYF